MKEYLRQFRTNSEKNPAGVAGILADCADGIPIHPTVHFLGASKLNSDRLSFMTVFFSEQLRRSFRPVSEQLQSSYVNFEISCLFYIHSLFISPLEFHQLRMVRCDKSSCIHQLFISTGYKQYSVNYE